MNKLRVLAYGALLLVVLAHIVIGEYHRTINLEGLRYDNLRPMSQAVGDMAISNQILNERIERSREVVRAIKEENQRLKVSLDDNVYMLREQIEDNDRLMNERNFFTYRIQVLQQAIKTLETALQNLKPEVSDATT